MQTHAFLPARRSALLTASALLCAACGRPGHSGLQEPSMNLPPLPILPPTALVADAGDGRAYLRWNLQLEDPRVVGWRVHMLAPRREVLTDEPLDQPHFVARGLENGTAYTFAVVGVLADGAATPPGNAVTVTPRATGTARVEGVRRGEKLAIGRFPDVAVGPNAVRIVFPDGQELVYDNLRPIDWRTRDGVHLIYPRHFGNGLDVGRFDPRGLPTIIPPRGLERDSLTVDGRTWAAKDGGAFVYRDAQFGTDHPHLTDPLTMPLAQANNDARARWFAPVVDGDRVTLHYWQPLVMMGYRSWQCVLVWETWWPIERQRGGTTYHGLARLVEVQMPEAWKDGYQVMLNNGFGPDGSREGVVSYSTGFRGPGREIVNFSDEVNRQVVFQYPKPPRRGYGYHPNHDSLQGSPLIFYEWDTPARRGCLTIAARSLY